MKAILSLPVAAALLAFAAPSANATVLIAGFHKFNNNNASESADIVFPGWTATLTKAGIASVGNGGSTDGFYGNSDYAAGKNDGYLRANFYQAVTITLTRTSDPNPAHGTLENLYFDAATAIALQGVSATAGYRLPGDPQIYYFYPAAQPVPQVTPEGTPANYADFSYSLAGLPYLNIGDSIQFIFNGVPEVMIDNIAITAIPEPGSALALGCLLGSGLLIRRNRRNLA